MEGEGGLRLRRVTETVPPFPAPAKNAGSLTPCRAGATERRECPSHRRGARPTEIHPLTAAPPPPRPTWRREASAMASLPPWESPFTVCVTWNQSRRREQLSRRHGGGRAGRRGGRSPAEPWPATPREGGQALAAVHTWEQPEQDHETRLLWESPRPRVQTTRPVQTTEKDCTSVHGERESKTPFIHGRTGMALCASS